MNEIELDSFLRKHTRFEEYYLEFPGSNKFGLNIDDQIAFYEKDFNKFYMKSEYANEYLENLSNQLIDDFIIPNDKNISFLIHPRFSVTSRHRHSYIELIYVYSGQCRQIINNKQVLMQEGDICILNTNVYHSIDMTQENDIIVNCLMKKSYLDLSFLSRLSSNDILSSFFIHSIYQLKDFNNYILFPSRKNKRINQVMTNLLCEYYDSNICSDEVIDSFMIILFSELLRVHKCNITSDNYSTSKFNKVPSILLYLQKNYKDATLESTAKVFNIDPNYMTKILKKQFGKTFIDIIHEIKLKKASILLETTDMPIESIIYEAGYSNVNFFYRIFKKLHGITPAEYRKKFRI